jgi:hypothetical protein
VLKPRKSLREREKRDFHRKFPGSCHWQRNQRLHKMRKYGAVSSQRTVHPCKGMRASKGRVTCYGLCLVGFYIKMGDVIQYYIGYFMTNTIGKNYYFFDIS